MKIEEQNVATFSVGRMETAVAGIQASAKAFEILSSGLYSDAEFAIVREIAANAWDSHKASGRTNLPFRLQIPTHLDPRFCIRDYGTSMTHEFMMTRVNTYFDSTKNDSNDEIGGFGLGIKSVFSYTTSFMIACFQGGIRRVYVYQIGETGLPEISLMAEAATDEPDGVEVSVPVQEADYGKFKLAVQKTFAFYEVKPEVYGVELNIPEFKKVVEGPNWFICGRHEVFDRDVYVEMGGIAYPVESNLHGVHSYGNRQTIFLKAGIGQIDITPNREQVKLTDRTRAFIKDAVENIRQQMFDIIQDKVDSAAFTNYWDAMEFITPFRSGMTHELGFKPEAIKFNGKTYDESQFTLRAVPAAQRIDPEDEESAFAPVVMTDDMVTDLVHFDSWELTRKDRLKKKDWGWGDNRRMSFDRFKRPNPIIVMEDRQGTHVARWMKANGQNYATIIMAKFGTTAKVVADVKSKLEDLNVVYNASELEYDKDLFKVAKGDRKLYIYRTGSWEAVSRTEVDYNSLPSPLYYILTDGRQQGQFLGKERHFKNESDFMSVVKNWLGHQIYYLTDAMVAKILKHRPTIVMETVEDKLEPIMAAKVKAAAATYFANDMTSLTQELGKTSYASRVDSAVTHWSKTFGLEDVAIARKALENHKTDRDLERMCRAIAGKTIFELFDDYGLKAQSVSLPSFDKLMATMPYAYALVDNYGDKPIIDHISETMGWPIVVPQTV